MVANVTGATLPQVITGNTIYASAPGLVWNTPTATTLSGIGSNDTTFPAVADLDGDGNPEIVLVDAYTHKLSIFNPAGALLTDLLLISGAFQCGGPPMIGRIGSLPGPQIGVATCAEYAVYAYTPGSLSPLWHQHTADASGQTTSTLFKDNLGQARIYYGDQSTIWVFNAKTGQVLQQIPTTSGTAIEGPVIAGFDAGPATSSISPGRLIVTASNYNLNGGQAGIRIFSGVPIGPARAVWNDHSYHQTNVTDNVGHMPAVETNSWVAPVNSYRVQHQ